MQMDNALSVSELNEYVRRLLAGDPLLRSVEVTGEISGYKHHISGHRYFSLKDSGARVQCVMFRQSAMGLNFQPQDGMRVRVRASASLFPRDGSYQLYISSMEKCGVGDLYLRFEQLKEKLTREGLFDPAVKKPIPLMPGYIGIATSLTGAAIRDMVRIARRRNPNVGIIVAPCAVQGAEAKNEIVRAIERLNADERAEVILAGRGGGSIEDLWAFNEECVARAIFASRIPVISCVGHETDFTIADFTADVRAATPSMGSEIAVPVVREMRGKLDVAMRRVCAGLMQGQRLRHSELNRLCAAAALRNPHRQLIELRSDALDGLWKRVRDAENEMQRRRRASLERMEASLRALNPEAVLERGYALVESGGHICSEVGGLDAGTRVQLRMRDGSAEADIIGVVKSEDRTDE